MAAIAVATPDDLDECLLQAADPNLRCAICQGVFARALQGNASAPDALALGALGFCECVRLGLEELEHAVRPAEQPHARL